MAMHDEALLLRTRSTLAPEASVRKRPVPPSRRAPRDDGEGITPLAVPLDDGALRPFFSDWERLARGAFFLRPSFFFATARHLAPGDALFAGAARGGRLVGALPLARQGRELVGLASAHTPRFDYAGDPGALPSVWRALDAVDGWDVLRFARVPEESPLVTELPRIVAAAGGHVAIHPHLRSPRFDLSSFEEHLARKFRVELRRTAKKLGDVRFERIARFDRKALREAFAIESASWKGAAGTAIACDPALTRFYLLVARLAAREGALTLAFLRVGERRVAMHFAVESGGTYHLLKPAYDPAFAAYGPGQLLMYEAARDARARGLSACDLLGHDDAWKRKWTSAYHRHMMVTVYRATPLGYARWVLARLRARAGHVVRAARAMVSPPAAAATRAGGPKALRAPPSGPESR